jgi:hypothetical protein
MTVRAAHAHGKWVGVCGELAADPLAVAVLLGLEVDELSVAARSIAEVKALVRQADHRRPAPWRAKPCNRTAPRGSRAGGALLNGQDPHPYPQPGAGHHRRPGHACARAGQPQQAQHSHAAGKGLNVAQVLADLGHSVTVGGFLGRTTCSPSRR